MSTIFHVHHTAADVDAERRVTGRYELENAERPEVGAMRYIIDCLMPLMVEATDEELDEYWGQWNIVVHRTSQGPVAIAGWRETLVVGDTIDGVMVPLAVRGETIFVGRSREAVALAVLDDLSDLIESDKSVKILGLSDPLEPASG